MAWKRNDPDPLEDRRRHLAELEKNLAEQRRRLIEQMQSGAVSPEQAARAEPLVWRNEDDAPPAGHADPTPARKRHLARQRRRDMVLAIALIVLLLIVLFIGLWIAHDHTSALPVGA